MRDDDGDMLCQVELTEYISLGFSDEEAGEVTSGQRTTVISSESSDLGVVDLDELTKPVRIMYRIMSDNQTEHQMSLHAQVEVLQKSFEELKEARVFEEAKEDNRKQYEEKLKSRALTMKEEIVKEANAKIAEMFAQYTQQLRIPLP
ncbi:hypothetical protein Tco_1037922, partial [Tanacetum coccineum]